jgi:hypothetical protein
MREGCKSSGHPRRGGAVARGISDRGQPVRGRG